MITRSGHERVAGNKEKKKVLRHKRNKVEIMRVKMQSFVLNSPQLQSRRNKLLGTASEDNSIGIISTALDIIGYFKHNIPHSTIMKIIFVPQVSYIVSLIPNYVLIWGLHSQRYIAKIETKVNNSAYYKVFALPEGRICIFTFWNLDIYDIKTRCRIHQVFTGDPQFFNFQEQLLFGIDTGFTVTATNYYTGESNKLCSSKHFINSVTQAGNNSHSFLLDTDESILLSSISGEGRREKKIVILQKSIPCKHQFLHLPENRIGIFCIKPRYVPWEFYIYDVQAKRIVQIHLLRTKTLVYEFCVYAQYIVCRQNIHIKFIQINHWDGLRILSKSPHRLPIIQIIKLK